MKHIIIFLLSLFAAPLMVQSAAAAPDASQSIRDWQALRYGMFIHFGMCTFTGREIDPGDKPSNTMHRPTSTWTNGFASPRMPA